MATSVNPLTSNAASSTNTANSSTTASATGTQQISENTFLQLLVAQLQNQDPMQPMDGMQFVTQLAQFSQLESTYGIQNDTDKLVADASGTTGSTTGSTGSTTPTTGS
jgi:flagellar basal-body rod modification protein FlgD